MNDLCLYACFISCKFFIFAALIISLELETPDSNVFVWPMVSCSKIFMKARGDKILFITEYITLIRTGLKT